MWIDNVYNNNLKYKRLHTHPICILYVYRHVIIKCSFVKFGEKGRSNGHTNVQVYLLIEHNTNHTED